MPGLPPPQAIVTMTFQLYRERNPVLTFFIIYFETRYTVLFAGGFCVFHGSGALPFGVYIAKLTVETQKARNYAPLVSLNEEKVKKEGNQTGHSFNLLGKSQPQTYANYRELVFLVDFKKKINRN